MLPKPNSEEFPLALMEKRKSLGLNRRQIADAAGIYRKAIKHYEENPYPQIAKPQLKTWIALNIVLGFTIDDEYKEIANSVIDRIKPVEPALKNVRVRVKAEPRKPMVPTIPKYFSFWQPVAPHSNHQYCH